ncbi:MAG: flagellar motor switch [Candidatus Scalindua rubra]|uniref:Flagellar motor switch protein FliM n=1 Tax=Candidatus Scalindua rubra TaxID=1872076 RepID=A0A1E3X516_9BACT|nr:MAG: flagellar motor switch [Candidatus Scalindua rubra]
MADIESAILSTDEVERLLETFHESQGPTVQTDLGEGDERIRYYDFKRPNTISRDKKRMLQKLFETTAYRIGRDISNYLRSSVKVSLNSIDELSFEIFKNTCSELIFINILRLKPLKGYGCLTLDMGLCLSIMEKAFGGSGKSQSEIRKLTDTEMAILENIVKIIIEKLNISWKQYDDMSWGISDTTMEPRYLNIATDAEVVLVASFAINLEYSFGEMKLCIPVSVMEGMWEKFHSDNPSDSNVNAKEDAEKLNKLAKDFKIVVTGVLDEANVTVSDIANLKEGDVLRLNNKITNNLKIAVEGKNKFYGKLGLFGLKKAIQITALIEDEST